MTLKQAFTMWACAPRNTVLAAKSRDAVQRVLMKKYNDMDLEVFTESFCRRIFSQSSERQEVKVKAASILVYLLQWGGDNGHCQRPTFTYEIAASTPEVESEPPTVTLKPEVLAKRQAELAEREEQKEEQPMEEKKKTRGKQPIPVAQIDPETLALVKVWPSRCEAERGTGACNIDRAIAKKRMAGGYFWCMPDDAEGFKPNPLSNRAPKSADKPKAKPKPSPSTGNANHRGQSPCTSQAAHTGDSPHDSRAAHDITVFTDQEIIDEIKRRGWQGNITMTINITL